jgi:glycosyltransferase involved in cell wall biosynthesis
MNETFSLEETVAVILTENPADIREILIVISPRGTDECATTAHDLASRYPIVRVIVQNRKFIGGALQDGFDEVRGEYTVLMSSDLETDPHTVRALIAKVREGYDIVTCTRWTGAGFSGYNPVKYLLNKVFQVFFGILYGTKLTDLTFAYRIFKTDIVKRIRWQELRHPFLFETIIKPLRLGYSVAEIPSPWAARKEGESQNTFWGNFEYFKIGFRVLRMSQSDLLK